MAHITMEERVMAVECRLGLLEVAQGKTDVNIENLIKRLDNLAVWIKALIITLIPCVLGGIGVLLMDFFKR